MQSQSESRPGTGASASTNAGRSFTIIGFVLAVAALVILPIVFGPLGAIFGGIGYSKGDKLGMWAVVAGIVGTIGGFALAAAVLSNK